MQQPAVVTPEAVPLELSQAGLGSRFVALMIDWTAQAALAFALLFAGIALAGDNSGLGVALFFLFLFLVLFGYPVILESLWKGRTLGKAALGLRVVTVEGAPIRFRHAAIRAALGLVDFYATSGAGAVLSALLTARGQRLGDLVAGTMVLRERSGLAAPAPTTFSVPPGLEGYAASLDVSGLSVDDYRAVRAYLLRAPALTMDVRYQLALGLAEPILARVRPAPPAGIHPAWFLICVAAVFQGGNVDPAPRPSPPLPMFMPPPPSAPPSPPPAWTATEPLPSTPEEEDEQPRAGSGFEPMR